MNCMNYWKIGINLKRFWDGMTGMVRLYCEKYKTCLTMHSFCHELRCGKGALSSMWNFIYVFFHCLNIVSCYLIFGEVYANYFCKTLSGPLVTKCSVLFLLQKDENVSKQKDHAGPRCRREEEEKREMTLIYCWCSHDS